MSATFDTSAFLRRLAISIGVVFISTLPVLRSDFRGGLISPWAWFPLLQDLLFHGPGLDIHPAVFVVATLAALGVAAIRPFTSMVVTLWFVANALGLWVLLWTFNLEPAG